MSKALALIWAVALAAGVWFASPLVSHDFSQAWLVGVGNWDNVAVHGRDIAAGVLGLLTWIGALHRNAH